MGESEGYETEADISGKTNFSTSIVAPLFDLDRGGYHTCIAGPSHARYVPCTDVAKHLYKKIFRIMDKCGLRYFVFAGALVGYVRNGRFPYWLDDMDIMIFEEDIPFFESVVLPTLEKCGLNCRPVGGKLAGSGYHILALQKSATRNDPIPFSEDVKLSVPWVQIDVFFSRVENGLVKNLNGWGLYNRKSVKAEWVFPGQILEMEGMKFPSFENIEADVLEEYGDVRNQLIVKTHLTTFLSAQHFNWHTFDLEFSRVLNASVSFAAPNAAQHEISGYEPIPQKKLSISAGASYSTMARQIIEHRPAVVEISDPDQIFWVMDLKRIFKNVSLIVNVSNLAQMNRAVMLDDFIDDVIILRSDLQRRYDETVEFFRTETSDVADVELIR